MPALVQFSISLSPLLPIHRYNNDSTKKRSTHFAKSAKPINYYSRSRETEYFRRYRFREPALRDKLSFSGMCGGKNGISASGGRRVMAVKANNGIGGGGGGKMNSETARVLGNLGLAILLASLSMTGQLGWLLDAIVSIWLIAVLVPVIGIGAFLWWAGRDIAQSSHILQESGRCFPCPFCKLPQCPNCGNEFQVFKSTLNDEVQLCPFCSQPFSVENDEFVRDPVKFSNQSTIFDQIFSEASPQTKKGKKSSASIVDVEAEIRDAD